MSARLGRHDTHDAAPSQAFPRLARALPPYSMRLDWDPDDAIFVVTVPELPGCVTHGRTRAEAVRQGEEAIAAWLGGAQRFGDAIPAPAVVQFATGQAEGEREGAF